MAEKKLKNAEGKVKKPKKDKKEKGSRKERNPDAVAAKAFTLLADDTAVDSKLSSLFAIKTPIAPSVSASTRDAKPEKDEADDAKDEVGDEVANEADLSEVDEADASDEDYGEAAPEVVEAVPERKRKRKQRDADHEDLEGAYMARLAREEERDNKRRKGDARHAPMAEDDADEDVEEEGVGEAGEVAVDEDADDDDVSSPPPKHETQVAEGDPDREKANRTVFLGNVSTDAISSKSGRKTLIKHLSSIIDEKSKGKLESIRFRSTPYDTKKPKKAAFAQKELMDATTKATNAYAVYTSPQLARDAAKKLNGTMVLDRHLRVDEIAHPAKTDHRRCVFVGNLGFVDDESNIQQANEDEGREVRKKGKEPADIEEGLWRSFGKCGNVESVRVIRDSTTRVGKGIAYVQFEDENAVETALLYDGKKFPPMLPRKLRVSRAKAIKRNAKPGEGKPTTGKVNAASGYQRKISGAEASQMGRASKLYGKAAAARAGKPGRSEKRTGANTEKLGNGIRAPEDFVFEGHRASSKNKPALKMAGGKKKAAKGKPTNRSAKRGAAYKAGQRTK